MGYNEVKASITTCLNYLGEGSIRSSVMAMDDMLEYVKTLEDRIEVLEI